MLLELEQGDVQFIDMMLIFSDKVVYVVWYPLISHILSEILFDLITGYRPFLRGFAENIVFIFAGYAADFKQVAFDGNRPVATYSFYQLFTDKPYQAEGTSHLCGDPYHHLPCKNLTRYRFDHSGITEPTTKPGIGGDFWKYPEA